MSDRLLTPEQIADRWQVPRSQVYRLTREGRIPTVPIGRYYRYRLDAIEEYERSGSADGTKAVPRPGHANRRAGA
jgi:excisionase family DNA binding protein